MLSITSEKIEAVLDGLNSGKKLSEVGDESLFELMRMTKVTGFNVIGSPATRLKYRNQMIRGNLMYLGGPPIFLTVNPHDIDNIRVNSRCSQNVQSSIDKLLQVTLLSGRHLPFDDEENCTEMPEWFERARLVATNPVACAKAFHATIKDVLTHLLNRRVGSDTRTEEHCGVFGNVAAFFGTIEDQKRGSMHFHCPIWLTGVVSDEVNRALASEDERQGVLDFFDSIVKASFHSDEGLYYLPIYVDDVLRILDIFRSEELAEPIYSTVS